MQEIARLHQSKPQLTDRRKSRFFRWRRHHFEILLIPIALTIFVLLWEGIIRLGNYPTFILPSPGKVATTFGRTVVDGTLWHHALATLSEVFLGLALGLVVATVLGYLGNNLRLSSGVQYYTSGNSISVTNTSGKIVWHALTSYIDFTATYLIKGLY